MWKTVEKNPDKFGNMSKKVEKKNFKELKETAR